MDGTKRGRKPPLEVRREFTTSRLEVQVLTQAYELIVPVVRRPISTARTLWDLVEGQAVEAPLRRMVQGA
ncbi:MAG: hypothetical protein V1790_16720 [Planctomycetota bacterium]